ncbi:MAG: hypothetical protein JXO22_08060 [Phycisphaerae bacterium]|nr:hypothetical protein [Phycisphaerae bacterium]
MTRLLLITSLLLLAGLGAADDQLKEVPADTPTSQPAVSEDEHSGRTTRKPFEDAILRELLKDADRPRLINPEDPDSMTAAPTGATPEPTDSSLMLEGTIIVERPATLSKSDERTELTFKLSDGKRTVTMELLPNSLLELAETAAVAGVDEFIISGEVTRYHGRNYMILRKVVHRLDHGNLSP